jgi:hypothetical protein
MEGPPRRRGKRNGAKEMKMRPFAVLLLFAALGAAGAPSSVTVQPSSIGFKDSLAACPAGTLAAISFTLGHTRIAEGAGVDSDIDDANPNAQTLTLSNGSKSATVMVNASKHTVAAHHVALASHARVACVAAD